MEFKLTSLNLQGGWHGETMFVRATIQVCPKAFAKLKDKGFLYGVCVSNEVFRLNSDIPAHNPTVDSAQRARRGRKTIYLDYDVTPEQASKIVGRDLKPHEEVWINLLDMKQAEIYDITEYSRPVSIRSFGEAEIIQFRGAK